MHFRIFSAVKQFTALSLIALLALFISSEASARNSICELPPLDANYINVRGVIFEGKLKHLSSTLGRGSHQHRIATFEVLRVWKGDLKVGEEFKAYITLFFDGHFQFIADTGFLVFPYKVSGASYGLAQNVYNMSLQCDYSRPLYNAHSVITKLETLLSSTR